MSIEDSRIFTLTAKNASFLNNDSKLSNVTFQLTKFVERHPDNMSVYLSIENATIPSSWFNVPEQTSISFLRLDTNATSTYVIPGGNYDAYSLCNTINANWSSLTAESLKFEYNLQNNKLHITVTAAWLGSPIYYQFTTNSDFIFGSAGVLSVWKNSVPTTTPFPNQVNLTGVSVYLIVCDECPTQNFSLELTGNVLGSIQNAASNFGVTIWQNNTNLRYLLPVNRQIDQVSLRIYNERGELIDFNNTSWSMTLKVTYYKSTTLKARDFQQFMAEINRIIQPAEPPEQPASSVPEEPADVQA